MGWQDAPLAKQASWAAAPLAAATETPKIEADPTGGFFQNLTDATGGALTRAGNAYQQAANSVGQAVRSVLPTGANAALDRANTGLGLPTADQAQQNIAATVAEHQRLDAPLNHTAGGLAGNVVGGALTLAPALALPGAQTIAGTAIYNGALSGLLTPGNAAERTGSALGGAAGALGGKALGEGISNALASRLQAATQAGSLAKTQNAVRDATLQAGQEAGYVVPPTTVSQGVGPNILEAIGGKIKTAQSAAVKNQTVTNSLARASVGLSEDTPLTKSALQGIRSAAGDAYDAVASSGAIKADSAYTAAINNLGSRSAALSKEFPELANSEIASLTAALNKPGFSSESAVELLKRLRFDGYANKALQDPAKKALGTAQVEAAQAVESLVDRNLAGRGQADLLQNFRDARQLIAKTYTVEGALNEGSGNVLANKLAAQLNKGKPLSGELRQVAEFSQAFPKATQEINTSTPMFTPLDVFAGGVGAGTGNPLAIALTAARPGARALALSPLLQKSLAPQYGPGLLGRQLPQIADNALMRALLQYGSAVGTANGTK